MFKKERKKKKENNQKRTTGEDSIFSMTMSTQS